MSTVYDKRHKDAALACARRGVPVFPCEPGGKKPLTERGFKDATTDPRRITAWWTRWPDANIGAPTGTSMGAFVVDVDPAKGGLESLRDLEAEHRKLPETARVRTGGGGLHFYFRPREGEEVRNSAGKLGPGLDVRGTGGYVLLPPSVTDGAYEWCERGQDIADAPEWLVTALNQAPRRSAGQNGSGGYIAQPPEIPHVIPDGQRNDTLARIAGALRCRGAEREDLEAELLRINRERCDPPLPVEEVEGIAASIARYPAGNASPGPDADTLAALDEVEAAFWRAEWRGMGGKSARDVVVVLIKLGRKHGRPHPAGVEVAISVRALALAAALSKRSAYRALARLKDAGWLARSGAGSDTEAGALVLRRRASWHHSAIEGGSTGEEEENGGRGDTLRAPLSAPRLRWSGPHPDDREHHILRLGKTCGAVVDALEAAGGTLTVAELAETLGVKRPRDLRRRIIARLEERGIVTVAGETVALVEEWPEALNAERERAYEIAAYRRDVRRYDQEREGYRNRHENKPDRAPSSPEMRSAGAERHEKRRRRARAVLSDPSTPPGAVYRTDRYGDHVEYLACAMAAYEGEPEAWRAWREPVEVALRDLDGVAVRIGEVA